MEIEQFAWREIVTRVFEGFEVQRDLAPDWLVNPDTGRLLKLNYFYPEIGLAVRLEGMRGREQRREPDEVEYQRRREREAIRERLCEERGIRLLRFDVYDEPAEVYAAFRTALSWALRQAAKAELSAEGKLALVDRLRTARDRLEEIRAAARTSRDLKTWADLWVDRAYQETRAAPGPAPRAGGAVPRYVLNMHVRHPEFGTGHVIALTDEDGDQIITVRFDNGDDRQFLAQFVADKLRPV
ncbi:MAG: hypothetical protein ACYC5O_04800 [Anaerolineae bacterium]